MNKLSTVDPENLSEPAKQLIRGWLRDHAGSKDALARWMSAVLQAGSVTVCRQLIKEAV